MEIKEIKKLSLKPDDIIVVRFNREHYKFEEMYEFHKHLSNNVFKFNEVILLPSNIDLSIISQKSFPDIKKYFADI